MTDTIESKLDKYCEIYKINDEQRVVTGVVLEPDTPDLQGDTYDASTIEKAAHGFLIDSRVMGLTHKDKAPDVYVAESYIAPEALNINKQIVKKGTWLMTVKVASEQIWKDLKSGEYNAFSIGGYAKRTPITA